MVMEMSFLDRHPLLKDAMNITVFLICVIIGTLIINTFVFRSFTVLGRSMETTMYTGDRLIVNRIPVTWAHLQNHSYIPERGEVIVFRNPRYEVGSGDEYIVKRVIAFEGERVKLKDGSFTVYNDSHPDGFNPDDDNNGEPGTPTTGEVDMVVPADTIFVSGDHREGNYSYDSRNGLGTIPLYDIVGPVGVRIFPFDKVRSF